MSKITPQMSQLKLLVVEDNESTAKSISIALKKRGIKCDIVANGVSAIKIAKLSHYDLITLDLMLKDISGIDLINYIRKMGIKTPIVVISAIASLEKKVQSLNCGADDYITKPFNCSEFLARINAISRRFKPRNKSIVKVGELIINFLNRTIEVNGKQILITYKEYTIIELMVLRRGSVVSKETLINHLYSTKEIPDPKILDVFICNLRKKLADAANGKNFIQTVWGRGYTLSEPENNKVPIDKKQPAYY